MKQAVAIIGLGYVGLPLAVLTATKGYSVYGIDLDEDKLAQINAGKSPLGDDFVAQNLTPGLITASSDSSLIAKADIVIICVPTPVKNDYQPDLAPLEAAVRSAAKHLKPGALLIIESTINPGVTDEVIIPLIRDEFKLSPGKDFYISHCPERINPGDKTWNVTNIPRVVGSFDAAGLKKTVAFYESIIDADIKPMGSLKEAEAVKIVENTFRDVNIAFVNELAMSFSRLGINVVNVIDGAATKPFAFMAHYPGAGVGGHCIPVDPYYLIEYARTHGFDHDFLSLARKINNRMPAFAVGQLIDGLNEAGLALSRAKIAVLGISYKPNVGDDRESPAYKIIKILREKGVEDLAIYDPHFPDKSTVSSLDAAIAGKDAVVLATAHREFIDIDYASKGIQVLLDGRNAITHWRDKTSIIYRGVGVS